MRLPAALYPIVLALGAIILAQEASGQEQDAREQGPIKITKCQVISQSGSYVLANNLAGQNPMNSNCLFITASFVTIDLAGFTISGRTGFDGDAIASFDQQLEGIAVRNGTMVGGAGGVTLFGTGSVVEGVRVFADPSQPVPLSGIGINVFDGIVKGNTVVGRAAGIQAGGTVTGNFVENTQQGFVVLTGSTVIGNTALNNSFQGIGVFCPANVTNNTATGSSAGNIELQGEGCNNTNNVAP